MRTSLTPRRLAGTIAVAALVALTAACSGGGNEDGGKSDSRRREEGYDFLVAEQPAEKMDYSPTRETINFWIRTWSEPGKLSFVYLQGANGEMLGYYVLEGLPVSYCAALTPTFEVRGAGGDNGDGLVVPAPGMDAAYYSGGQCNTYYGKDATTGAYVEYTAGLGINVLLFDEPLPRQDVEPLGPTSVNEVPAAERDGVDEGG